MGEIYFKKPNKKSIMPFWATEFYNKEDVATILHDTIKAQRSICGDLLELYFGQDETIILDILTKNEFQPEFIYEHLNSEFGRGIILGILMSLLKDEVYKQEGIAEDDNQEE